MEVSELETLTEKLNGSAFDALSAKAGRSLIRGLPAQSQYPHVSPVAAIEDDEGATGNNYVSRRGFAAVLGVRADEARALFGFRAAQDCTRD